jgi:hypothetical protein
MRKTVLFLVSGLVLSSPVFGQRRTATLSGTVTDSSGAIVPEAQVTATAGATGEITKGLSNREGFYPKKGGK